MAYIWKTCCPLIDVELPQSTTLGPELTLNLINNSINGHIESIYLLRRLMLWCGLVFRWSPCLVLLPVFVSASSSLISFPSVLLPISVFLSSTSHSVFVSVCVPFLCCSQFSTPCHLSFLVVVVCFFFLFCCFIGFLHSFHTLDSQLISVSLLPFDSCNPFAKSSMWFLISSAHNSLK